MGAAGGPNMVEDGMVFYYDTGNGKSYKGAPTTNYASVANSVTQTSYSSYSATADGTWNAKHPNAINAINADGTSITGYINTGVTDWTNTYHAIWEYDAELNKPVVVMDCTDSNWKAKSFAPSVSGTWASNGWGVGTKYVISWLQWTTHLDKSLHVGLYTRNSSNSNNFWDGLSNNSTTSRNTKVQTWQRVYHVYTVTSNWDQTIDYTRIYMYGQYFRNGAGVKIKVADVQLEIDQDYASPFTGNQAGVSGRSVRSATEGLKDFTGNSTIDLTNVSFDSNAQMTFDGTNDDINVGPGTSTSFQRTIEMVFKTNTLGYLYPLAAYTRGGSQSVVTGKRMWLGFQSNKFQMHGWGTSDPASTTTIQTGQYYHAVYAYDQVTKKHYIWINGVLENNSTNDQSGFTGWSASGDHNWFVGGDPDCASWTASAGRSLNGDIPIFKVYDRILSTEEVKNHFNGIRSRFGI